MLHNTGQWLSEAHASVAAFGGQSHSSTKATLGTPNSCVVISPPPYYICGRNSFYNGGEPSSNISCCCTIALPFNYSQRPPPEGMLLCPTSLSVVRTRTRPVHTCSKDSVNQLGSLCQYQFLQVK